VYYVSGEQGSGSWKSAAIMKNNEKFLLGNIIHKDTKKGKGKRPGKEKITSRTNVGKETRIVRSSAIGDQKSWKEGPNLIFHRRDRSRGGRLWTYEEKGR